jgi:phosphatidylserine/phosphatidylglycerophosphate/cardiolipin synthase-like enzyme
MRILNNIDSSHFDELKYLIKDADELFIISPFLMESFDDFFDRIIVTSGVKRIVLITTLKDNDPDLFKKANSLHSIVLNSTAHNISYYIHIDNKLHGKIYIASKGGNPLRGIITSANFTDQGLNHNHEWGVFIDEQAQLKKILEDIISVSSHALSHEELHNIITKIDNFSRNSVMPKTPKINLEINNLIKKKAFMPGIRYFIKPVGYTDKPFEISRRLAQDIEKMHFAKRPKSVRIGDILICYAVGTTKLLGYFEVTSDPYVWDSSSRWPWEVEAKNLCPAYSESWNKLENTISSIQASFNTKSDITNNGGKTLGALQRGVDKIWLTEEFAHHVINIIDGSVVK